MVLGGACLIAQGPLPGDVAMTRALQSAMGDAPAWAQFVTNTAKFPDVWITLCVAVGLMYARDKWWGAVIPPLALLIAYLVDAAASCTDLCTQAKCGTRGCRHSKHSVWVPFYVCACVRRPFWFRDFLTR